MPNTRERTRRHWAQRTSFVPPTPPGEGTGDQAASNTFAYSGWDGLEPQPTAGFDYAPFESMSIVDTNTLGWKTPASASEPFMTNRQYAYGPAYLPETAAQLYVDAALEGGGTAGAVRLGAYNGNGSFTTNDYISSGTTVNARPTTLIGMSSEITVAINAAGTWFPSPAAINSGTVGAGFIWPAIWRDNVGGGVSLMTFPAGMNSYRVRVNSSVNPYTQSGTAAANFPGDAQTSRTNRVAGALRFRYDPVAPSAPTSLAATAMSGERGYDLTWVNTDVRTTRTRVERNINSAGWVIIAVVEGATYPDTDLPAAASVEYRVVACYKNVASSPSSTASGTVAGVRYAYATATLTLIAGTATLQNPYSGLYGKTHTIPTVTQDMGYKRTGGTNWEDVQPSADPDEFDWSAYSTYLGSTLASDERATVRTRAVANDGTNTLPSFVSSDTYSTARSGNRDPKWMNAQVWTWIQAWIASFGANFASDARIAWMKFGIYGPFGEWSGTMAEYATAARKIAIIDAMLAAFPNHKFTMNFDDDEEVMTYALAHSRVVGIEQLALGDSPYMWRRLSGDCSYAQRVLNESKTMWRLTEDYTTDDNADSALWLLKKNDVRDLDLGSYSDRNLSLAGGLGASNLALLKESIYRCGYRFDVPRGRYPSPIVRGRSQVYALAWHNSGNNIIPDIDAYQPRWELRQSGVLIWSTPVSLALSEVVATNDAHIIAQKITVTGISAGTYDLCISIPSLGARIPAIKLGLTGQQAGGEYIVHSGITVQ